MSKDFDVTRHPGSMIAPTVALRFSIDSIVKALATMYGAAVMEETGVDLVAQAKLQWPCPGKMKSWGSSGDGINLFFEADGEMKP